MKKKMTTTGDMKIASEEDLLTLDANTGEKFYRPFIPEDFQRFEAETIHVREVAQRAIAETQWDTGEPGAFFKVLHHTNCILRTRLLHYRNQVKDFRARAYVTLYNIYDAQMEQLWHQLSPTLTELLAFGEKTLKSLTDLVESCPASVFKKIVRASDPQEEPGMMPADYEDLKSLAVERMTESMRFVISLAEEIEMWITDLCGTRKVRSAPEETIIYRFLQKEFEETRQKGHLARVEKQYHHDLFDRKAEANMNILQILLDKTENHYNVHKICKLWSNRYRLGIEETEAFAHELSRHTFTKEDFEELFKYQAEHKMLAEIISKRNEYERHGDPLFVNWVDPYKLEKVLRFWIKANIKTKQQWYIVWCMMKYTFNMIREGQEKSDFAKRMNQMFEEAEAVCEVNSFRRLENKLNHNRHFSYWTKESDPDYSIAESFYQKLKNKENFTRHE